MIRHEMCLMKHEHKRGENMFTEKEIKFIKKSSTFIMEDEKFIAELLYNSFKYKNEERFRKNEPKMNQRDTNKMISQRYQNVSMKRNIKKTALYCGKVKF